MSFLTAKIVPLVQNILQSRGLEIRRMAKEQGAGAATIDVLSLCVSQLQSRTPDLFFVQIGAHDGLTGDPMRPFIEKFGWRRLLVEPQPKLFEKLTQNYQNYAQLILENMPSRRRMERRRFTLLFPARICRNTLRC